MGRPRAWWHHVPSGAFALRLFFGVFFFDWNTHFVVFSGGVEQGLGGPTARSSWKIRQNKGWRARRLADFFRLEYQLHYFSVGFEQGLGGPTARSSLKFCQNGGWEARRLDPAGMITPPRPTPAATPPPSISPYLSTASRKNCSYRP